MQNQRLKPFGKTALVVCSAFLGLLGTAKAFADIEIDLDEATKPAPTAAVKLTPTPANATHQMPTTVPVVPPTMTPIPIKVEQAQPTPTPEEEKFIEGEEPTPAPQVVHGKFKMKNYYDAGIKAYKGKEYDRAIRYLTQAVKTKDSYTPKFYYAEAYATLGLIYQFHIIHYDKAYNYYRMALKYEKRNHTARKYINAVKKHLR